MACIALPKVPTPQLPAGLSFSVTVPPLPGLPGLDLCCKLPPIPIPLEAEALAAAIKALIPPGPVGIAFSSGLIVILNETIKKMTTFINSLSVPCPLE